MQSEKEQLGLVTVVRKVVEPGLVLKIQGEFEEIHKSWQGRGAH